MIKTYNLDHVGALRARNQLTLLCQDPSGVATCLGMEYDRPNLHNGKEGGHLDIIRTYCI